MLKPKLHFGFILLFVKQTNIIFINTRQTTFILFKSQGSFIKDSKVEKSKAQNNNMTFFNGFKSIKSSEKAQKKKKK